MVKLTSTFVDRFGGSYVTDIHTMYFDSTGHMNMFLSKLNKTSKERYRYEWNQVKGGRINEG